MSSRDEVMLFFNWHRKSWTITQKTIPNQIQTSIIPPVTQTVGSVDSRPEQSDFLLASYLRSGVSKLFCERITNRTTQ